MDVLDKAFTCETVRRALWEMDPCERAFVESHLNECAECALYRGEIRSLRSGLRNLQSVAVPQLLSTRLRVMASRDRSRRLVRRDFSSWLADQKSRAMVFFDNLLRPFAVPAAGGILASCLCFGTLVDTLHLTPGWDQDMPIGISTHVAFDKLSPFNCDGRDIMVELSVDSSGNVTDWRLPHSANASSEEIQEIGNLVLYSTFTPAIRLGQRIASKQYVLLSHTTVKG